MDRYFAKFTRATPKAQSTSVMQLAKFHRSWNYIHDKRANVSVHQTQIPQHLKTMVDLLVDEEIRQDADNTGACMEYLMRNGVLTILVNIADADFPDGLRGEVVHTITNMINLLDDKFLVHGAVFKPTLKLIRSCVEDPVASERYHEELVDLMYVICSKIHGFPDLLNIFFHDRTWLRTPLKRGRAPFQPTITTTTTAKSNDDTTAATTLAPTTIVVTDQGISPISPALGPTTQVQAIPASTNLDAGLIQPRRSSLHPNPTTQLTGSDGSPAPDYEFLLFTYLLRFLHREGKAGDYARTALLFIIELASGALGEFVLHASSFPAVAAAAVGALYSQLPRSLFPPETGEEDEEERLDREDFRLQLDGFTKSLVFCQDVIDKCPMIAVGDIMLMHVQNVFLENILWPSLYGCVDNDGSAEAVVTYADLVLRSLREPKTIVAVLGFLKMAPDASLEKEDLLFWENDEWEKTKEEAPNGGFDLRRLVLQQLQSENEGSIVAALNLLQTILTKFCNYACRFVGGEYCDAPSPRQYVKHSVFEHEREMELYMSVVTALNPNMTRESSEFINGYDRYLWDAESALESHIQGIHSPRNHGCYQVDPKSPICRQLTRLLIKYFENSRRLNLALSGVISALALCPCRNINGWLACEDVVLDGVIGKIVPDLVSDSDETDSERQPSLLEDETDTFIERSNPPSLLAVPGVTTEGDNDGGSIRTTSTMVGNHLGDLPGGAVGEASGRALPVLGPPPPLYRTLELLAAEVSELRSEFPEFEVQLRQRRKGLMVQTLEPAPSSTGEEKTLAELVDGTVLLEEMVKEWMSFLQARRGLGIDLIRFE